MATRLLLIRHAKSEMRADLPEAEWPLSDEGRRQADKLAADLLPHGVEALWSSPYPRAIATVEPFSAASGLSINLDHDLRERLLSPDRIEDFEAPLRRSFEDEHFALHGGESGFQCRTRVLAALQRIALAHEGQTIAVVSHGNAIALMLSSLDPSIGFDFWKAIRNPDLFELRWGSGFSWHRT